MSGCNQKKSDQKEVKTLPCQLEEECVLPENTEHLIFMFVYNTLISGAKWYDFVHDSGLLRGIHIHLVNARKISSATCFLKSTS